MRFATLFLVLLLSAPSLAEVKSVISGPTQGNAGDLVVLDGSASKAAGWKWILPEGLQTLSCGAADTPGQIAFASGKAGSYTFGLIVADKDAAIDYVTHTVKIVGSLPGPVPEPIPDPVPDDPTPTPVPELDKLKKLSMESAAKLADDTTAKAISTAILNTDRAIEQMCAGGQCPGLNATKQLMVAAIEQSLLGRRGAGRNVNWLDGWRRPVNDAIEKLNAADVPTYRAAMRAVASGLSGQ